MQKVKTISNVKSTKKNSQTHYSHVYVNLNYDKFKNKKFKAIEVGDCKLLREESKHPSCKFYIEHSGFDEVMKSKIKGRSTQYHRAAKEIVIKNGLLEKTGAEIYGISPDEFLRIQKYKERIVFNCFVKDIINICYFYKILCVVTLSNGEVVRNRFRRSATLFC